MEAREDETFDSVDDTIGDSHMLEPSVPVPTNAAPRYSIPRRNLSAVEIPAVVQNIDRAVQAFGRAPSLKHVSSATTKNCIQSDLEILTTPRLLTPRDNQYRST